MDNEIRSLIELLKSDSQELSFSTIESRSLCNESSSLEQRVANPNCNSGLSILRKIETRMVELTQSEREELIMKIVSEVNDANVLESIRSLCIHKMVRDRLTFQIDKTPMICRICQHQN